MATERPETPADIDDPTIHHVSQRKKRRGAMGPAGMQLNLTSMIDVVFLLLIYFVVTAGFNQPEGVLTTNLPSGASKKVDPTEPPKQKLKIVLKPSSRPDVCFITVAGQNIGESFSALASKLAALQYDPKKGRNGRFKPDDPVVIMPSTRVRWQHVVNAFNAAVRNRYTNVAFARASAD